MEPIILTIEDDAEIASFIQNVLSENGFLCHVALSGTKGLEMVASVRPDLVLLDLNLPDVQGETVCKRIKAEQPDLPVIILTAQGSPADMAHGLNFGADDYVAKPFSEEVLVARVHARLRETNKDNGLLQVGDLSLNSQTHEVTRAGVPIELSSQEFKLLYYLMKNENIVLSRDMILSRIWGTAIDVETRVVDVYIGYLRKKIDKPFPTPLIHSIRGFGYTLKK
jgi:two-component system OmpR family response regulator